MWTAGHAGAPSQVRVFDLLHERVEQSVTICAAEPHMVWTGTKALVWGGLDCVMGTNQALQRGWMLDPFLGTVESVSGNYHMVPASKVAMDEATVPGPRAGGMAFWAGYEMIVFGGTCPQANCYTQGARFDPALNIWTTMSTLGAPSAASSQVGVWTGQEMLVFGTQANTSGRWHQASNTWTSLSLPNFTLAARTAVWTGTEMIVWDGAQGASYDPTTDTWQPIASQDVPVSTSEVRAVWTGSEMIVVHRYGGAHYDPTNDSWLAINSAYRIRSSSGRKVIWTGTELFVGDDTKGGGRYRPKLPGESTSCEGDMPGALSALISRPGGMATTEHTCSGRPRGPASLSDAPICKWLTREHDGSR